MGLEIRQAGLPDLPTAFEIVSEYYAALNVEARDARDSFEREYFAHRSAFWLAYVDAELAGCVALRALPGAETYAEIKRMYVRPAWRGRGIAQKLLEAAEAFATGCGYSWIYLDTANEMRAAARLYQRNAYKPCARYNDNPQAGLFFRKRLATR